MTSHIDRRRGMAYGLSSLIILTPDSLTLRLADFDIPTLIAGRGVLCSMGVITLMLAFGPRTLPTGKGLLAAIGYGTTFCLGMMSFVYSIKLTHVANVLVIISSAPLVAAALSVMFLREKLAWYTWVAAVLALVAAALVFAAESPVGFAESGLGNLYSIVNVLMLASGMVIVRRFANVDIVAGVAAGSFMAGAVWMPFADFTVLNARQWTMLIANGFFIQGVSFWLLTRASRLLPPPEISLLFLIELALAPGLVWLVLDEQPANIVLIAGAAMITVFLVHTWVAAKFQPSTQQLPQAAAN